MEESKKMYEIPVVADVEQAKERLDESFNYVFWKDDDIDIDYFVKIEKVYFQDTKMGEQKMAECSGIGEDDNKYRIALPTSLENLLLPGHTYGIKYKGKKDLEGGHTVKKFRLVELSG